MNNTNQPTPVPLFAMPMFQYPAQQPQQSDEYTQELLNQDRKESYALRLKMREINKKNHNEIMHALEESDLLDKQIQEQYRINRINKEHERRNLQVSAAIVFQKYTRGKLVRNRIKDLRVNYIVKNRDPERWVLESCILEVVTSELQDLFVELGMESYYPVSFYNIVD